MPRKSADSRAQVALDALNALEPVAPRTEQLAAALKALNDKHFLVVARAATVAGERLLHELAGDLVYAYARFLKDPVKRDPGCRAKQAIARALVTLECQDLEFYRAGIVYRQLEPAWGRPTDTATDVRCSCAMGLAAAGHSRAIAELTALLVDPEPIVRSGAARAISCGNPQEAEAVLRFKVHIGDTEPQVLGECFSALLIIEPRHSLPFVAGYLRHADEALRELAALALGESRLPEGLTLLREAWEDAVMSGTHGALIRGAALHRSEAAFEWLLDIIATGSAGRRRRPWTPWPSMSAIPGLSSRSGPLRHGGRTNMAHMTSPTRIYLIRHGQSQANAGGMTLANPLVPLTALGELQARALAPLLPPTPVQIWASPFKRTLDTAAPYCARMARAAATHDGLREFETIDTVALHGTTCEERETVVAGYWMKSDPAHRSGPAAETFREFHERVARARDEFLRALPDGSIIFGHGMWMALLFWQIWGFATVDRIGMTLFRRFQLGFPTPNAGVYCLSQVTPGNWVVAAEEASMRAIAALEPDALVPLRRHG